MHSKFGLLVLLLWTVGGLTRAGSVNSNIDLIFCTIRKIFAIVLLIGSTSRGFSSFFDVHSMILCVNDSSSLVIKKWSSNWMKEPNYMRTLEFRYIADSKSIAYDTIIVARHRLDLVQPQDEYSFQEVGLGAKHGQRKERNIVEFRQ